MTLRRAIAILLAVFALGTASLHAGPYSQMVVFGDSLSDTGNVDDISFGFVPGSDYWEGRFSNGPLWEEHVAEEIGLPTPTPSRDGGLNFAFGGAETGGGSIPVLPPFISLPNLGTQIDDYLDDHRPNGNILYMVWGGGNDFLEGDTTNPAVPAANLADHVRTLAAAGARNFIVPNLPLMGQLPRHRGTAREAIMDSRSRQFSVLLAGHLDTIERDLGVTIFRPDVLGFFEQVIADPASAGLINVTQPALDSGTNNPDGYLFWDDIHPSRAGHRLLGEQVASMLVPFETHALVSAESTTAWTDPQAWAPTGVPNGNWNARVFNWRDERGRQVVVEGNRQVNRLSIEGKTHLMQVLIDTGATLTVSENAEVIGTGGIVIRGGTLTAERVDLQGGLLFGNGTVRGDVLNAGELAASGVGGPLRIDGDFRQMSAGTLTVFIGGLNTNQFSQLEVTGAATLAGPLSVSAVDDFEMLPGDRFEFLTFASRDGQFSSLEFVGPAGLSLAVDYDDDAAVLLAGATGGDANLDGAVTAADLDILRQNWKSTDLERGWRSGDFNQDGQINLVDLIITAQNWQAGVPGGSPAALDVEAFLADMQPVPEPSGACLLAIGLSLILLRQIRSGRRIPATVPTPT
ncbi:MAG: hypothetical protein IID44_02655 [Planctomycetes bacterium]|nr:hypothetical protein [Planctomycetota bacterium]